MSQTFNERNISDFEFSFLSSKLTFFTLEENVEITEALILKLVNFDEFKRVDVECFYVSSEFLFTCNNLYGFRLAGLVSESFRSYYDGS